jgi:hypothetical protein
MTHLRDDRPLYICSDKSMDHGSTSRVRSQSGENRTVKPPKENLSQTTIKKNPTQQILEAKPSHSRIWKQNPHTVE